MACAGSGAVRAGRAATVPPESVLLNIFPEDTAGLLFIDFAELRSVPFVAGMIEEAGIQIPEEWSDFSAATGFDVPDDLERVAVGSSGGSSLLAAARASYDPGRIADYFEQKQVATEWHGEHALYQPQAGESWKLSFVDGWVLVGQDEALRSALDRLSDPVGTAMNNASLVAGIQSIEDGSQVWAVGSFDHGLVPEGVAPPMASDLIAALERGTYEMRFGEVVTGRAMGEFGTVEAADRTFSLLQGLLSLGRIQAAEYPELLQLLDGIRIESLESAVRLSFAIDPALLDSVSRSMRPSIEPAVDPVLDPQ